MRLKSQIIIAGIDPYTKKDIMDMFGFQLGSFPAKYLGLPLAGKKLNIQHYSPLIDQFCRVLNATGFKPCHFPSQLSIE